jgi:hypothetical protein
MFRYSSTHVLHLCYKESTDFFTDHKTRPRPLSFSTARDSAVSQLSAIHTREAECRQLKTGINRNKLATRIFRYELEKLDDNSFRYNWNYIL